MKSPRSAPSVTGVFWKGIGAGLSSFPDRDSRGVCWCEGIFRDSNRISKRRIMTIWILAVALLAGAELSHAAVAVRVLLGVGDQAETDWSDGIVAQGAAIAAVEPWLRKCACHQE